MKAIKFVFKDYIPIEVRIDENDINNLMVILGYLNQGAVVSCTDKEDEYFVDMSFEDKPIGIINSFKVKWFLFKNRLKNHDN